MRFRSEIFNLFFFFFLFFSIEKKDLQSQVSCGDGNEASPPPLVGVRFPKEGEGEFIRIYRGALTIESSPLKI